MGLKLGVWVLGSGVGGLSGSEKIPNRKWSMIPLRARCRIFLLEGGNIHHVRI